MKKEQILEKCLEIHSQGFALLGADWRLRVDEDSAFQMLNPENKILCPLESCCLGEKMPQSNWFSYPRSVASHRVIALTLGLREWYVMGFVQAFDFYEQVRENKKFTPIDYLPDFSKGIEDGIWIRSQLQNFNIVSEDSIIPFRSNGIDSRFIKYITS